MRRAARYILESEFLEGQIEKDISSYLGYISRMCGPRFRLLQVDEALTGADAKFDWRSRAYYLQFKKPTGLKSPDAEPLPTWARRNEAETQRIRRFRRGRGLADTPHSLCFKLREMAQHASDFQHNILLQYEDPPLSRALYVCPTVLTRGEYEAAMSPGWFWRFFEPPFRLHDYRLLLDDVAYRVECAPLLRGHATIIPHARVTSAEHYYSFSVHGSDVVFHSPEFVRYDVGRLSDFIALELRDASQENGAWNSLAEVADRLRRTSRAWAGDAPEEPGDRSPIGWLQWHGRLLRERFGIRQMLMLARTE